jgi:hypothetical protein
MSDPVGELLEREAVIDTINELFVATDRRDWASVRECLAPRVHFDMTSLAGGQPADLAAEDIIAGWERGLRLLQAVHHQAGNYRVHVEGDAATAFCYGVAFHYLPNASGRNTRVFVGSYDFHLRKEAQRWRIDRFRFNLKFVDGNLELERSA